MRAYQGAIRPPVPEEVDVEGLRVPGKLDQLGVNSVLTQTVGKLRLKDLKALNEHRKSSVQTTASEGVSVGVGPRSCSLCNEILLMDLPCVVVALVFSLSLSLRHPRRFLHEVVVGPAHARVATPPC